MKDWNYFDKFESIIDKYMEMSGEGNTKASQVVTAVNKLIYKWYNDGDVYDNTCYLTGWANDLSSYANWLAKYTDENVNGILSEVFFAKNDDDYEEILKNLADYLLKEELLEEYSKEEKIGSIYECDGNFRFEEYSEEYDEEEGW